MGLACKLFPVGVHDMQFDTIGFDFLVLTRTALRGTAPVPHPAPQYTRHCCVWENFLAEGDRLGCRLKVELGS